MSKYEAIKAATNAYIKTNGRQEITGAILNAVMIATIDSLGRFYQFVGSATPDTDPGTIDQNIAYLASTPGTYTHLGGITIDAGELSVIKFDGVWKKEVIAVIPAKVSQLVNDLGFITNAVSDLVNYYTKGETFSKAEVTSILSGYYDKDEVDSIVSALTGQSYVVAWDGTAEPVVGDIPAGVSVTWGGNPYVGTLPASASTAGKIYLVSNGAGYDEYITTDNSGYAWVNIGTTSLDLSGYATKAELTQLEQEVDDLDLTVNGGSVTDWTEVTGLSVGYYNTNQDPLPTQQTASETTYSIRIPVTPGEIYKITGLGGNQYLVLYCTASSTREQLRKAEVSQNARTTPVELTIAQGEAYLYINLSSYDSNTDKVEKATSVSATGLVTDVFNLDTRVTALEGQTIPQVTSETGASTTKAASQKLVTDVSDKADALDEDMNGVSVESYETQAVTSGYYNSHNSTMPNPNASGITPSSTGTYCACLAVQAGDKFKITGKGGSNDYSLLYVTADSSKTKTRYAEVGQNSRTTPVELTIEQGEAYLYVNLSSYDSGTDKLEKQNRTIVSVGIKDKVNALGTRTVEVDLPDTIYAVVGDTLQLYYKSIFRCVNPYIYDIKVTCNIGAQYPRYYELTPTAGQIGERDITFTIKDENNETLGTKTVKLKVVSKSANPGAKNIFCVGASNTVGGQWAAELKKRLTTASGTATVKDGVTLFTPIGFSIPDLVFVGRKTANGVNLEATGGYNFKSYTQAGVAYVRLFFTQAQVPTLAIGDTYTDGTSVLTVEEINIPDLNQTQGYYGNINFTVSALPESVGLTLTRVSGSGDASITASAYSMSGNPFVNGGVIDIEHYADTYCNGQIDIVYTELFGNGLVKQYQTDFTETFAYMQDFIDLFLAEFPSCKFCINIMQNKDERGGLGVNYGAGTNAYAYPYGLKFGCHNLLTELQKYITENNLESTVFIVNTLNEFDCENDYRQTTKQVNPRSGVEEIFGVNGAHPADIGYYQMADAAVRAFIARFCQ